MMRQNENSVGWTLRGQALMLRGYAYGSYYPSLVFRIGGPPLPADLRAEVSAVLAATLPDFPALDAAAPVTQHATSQPDQEWRASLEWMLYLFDALQQACDLPVYEPARALLLEEPEAQVQIACCNRSLAPLGATIELILSLIEKLASGQPTQDCLKQLEAQFKVLGASGFQGGNVPRLIKAAYEMGMPFKEMPGQFFRFGQGRAGIWMDSTYTQNTGTIASRVARVKAICSQTLHMAGLPVPPFQLVTDAALAVRAAEKIGYPVVVKPSDSDGGLGVSANLQNRDEVTRAFSLAASVSSQVMVEKHIAGRDYRLTVHRGELIWAVERVPAGVTGNGKETIAALVMQENRNPARADSIHSPLKPIVIDDEALAYLSSQDLTPQTIPEHGKFVPLKRAANVNSGGMPVAVFDKVHPDNAQLAVAAAQAIRLDLAGIDLLIPDIAKSWREIGAGICEINGQPQIGGTTSAHIYPLILRREVGGSGRIPTILLLGSPPNNTQLNIVRTKLADQGLTVGWHDKSGVHIGTRQLAEGRVPLLRAGEMLAGASDVDVMVLSVSNAQALISGLPTARVDLVIDCSSAPAGGNQPVTIEQQQFFTHISRMLLPACDGDFLARGSLAKALGESDVAHSATIHIQAPDAPLPADWLVEAIIALRHGADQNSQASQA